MIINFIIIFWILNDSRWFFFNTFCVFSVFGFIYCDVHFFNQNAISWDNITLLNWNDISNNEIFNKNLIFNTILTSIDGHSCVVNFVLNLEELFFLFVFCISTNKCSQNYTTINSQHFHPCLFFWIEECEEKINSRCNDKTDHLAIFELFRKLIKEWSNWWKSNMVGSKNSFSSIDICFATNDTSFRISW